MLTAWRRWLLRLALPAHGREGLLGAVEASEALLASQEQHGRRRWRQLGTVGLETHVAGHLAEVQLGVRRDQQTGHPTAAHLAVRALMRLAAALEDS